MRHLFKHYININTIDKKSIEVVHNLPVEHITNGSHSGELKQ